MTLELPPELKWLEWVVGMDWPQGDEDALWRLKDAWHTAGQDLVSLLEDGDTAYYRVLAGVGGSLEQAFTAYWQQYSEGDDAYLAKLAQICLNLADHCDQTALQIEYAKYQFIITLAFLAIQIAWMIAMGPASFGASTAGIPVAEAAAQSFIRMIATNVIRTMIFMIVQNVLTDVAVQLIQLGEGHRTQFDASKTIQAAEHGAEMGAVFGLAGGLVHLPAAKLAPNLLNTTAGRLVEGGALNVVGALGMSAVTGQGVDLEHLGKAFTSGAAWTAAGYHPGQMSGDHPVDPLMVDHPSAGHDLLTGGREGAPTVESGGLHEAGDRLTPDGSEPPMSSAERIDRVLSGGRDPLAPSDLVGSEPSYHDPSGPRYDPAPGGGPIEPAYHAEPAAYHAEPAFHSEPAGHPEPLGYRDPSGLHDPSGPSGSPEPSGHPDPVGASGPRDPVGYQEPAGYRDPATSHEPSGPAPGGDRDLTGLSGAQSATFVDAQPGLVTRAEPVAPDAAQRGSTPAPAPAAFAGPLAAPLHEAPSVAGGPRSEPAAPTVPRPRTEPTSFGHEPQHSTVEPGRPTAPNRGPGRSPSTPDCRRATTASSLTGACTRRTRRGRATDRRSARSRTRRPTGSWPTPPSRNRRSPRGSGTSLTRWAGSCTPTTPSRPRTRSSASWPRKSGSTPAGRSTCMWPR